jgi:hypothetical protein
MVFARYSGNSKLLVNWRDCVKLLIFCGLFFSVLLLAAAPVHADRDCHGCDRSIIGEPDAWWGGKPFCSTVCKDRFYENYIRENPTRCKICKIDVTLPGVVQHQGTTTFIVVGNTWDGYCDDCRDKLRAGLIETPPPEPRQTDPAQTRSRAARRLPRKQEFKNPELEKEIDYLHKPTVGFRPSWKWILIVLALIGAWVLRRNV